MRRLILAVALALAVCQPAAAQLTKADLAIQLKTLSDWLPGRYDNHEQIVRQSGGGLSVLTNTPFIRLHTRIEKIDAPGLGGTAFYFRQYENGDETQPTAAQIYVASIDAAQQAVRLTGYLTPQPAKDLTAASLKGLAIADLKPASGCDFLLRYVGNQFRAQALGKCAVRDGFSISDMALGPDFMWVRDTAPKAAGTARKAAPVVTDGWYQQTRARMFSCTVFSSADGVMEHTKYLTTIYLHDQGGEADIAWPDGRTLTFTIHTRAFTVPAERENPLFRVHEKGNRTPIAYGYAVDGSKRFGLNLGWFYIRCYAEGDENPLEPGYVEPAARAR